MRLFFPALAVLSIIVTLFHQSASPERNALACSIAPSTLEDHVPGATFIGIVEVVRVGGERNEAPPLTATSTPTSEGADLTPTVTPTPNSFIDFNALTPSPTPTVPDPLPSYAYTDLRGRGADVAVIEELVGSGARELRIDWEARAALERRVREAEARRSVSSCGVGGLPEYRVGQRYFVVARAYESLGLATVSSYRIEGDDAVFGPYVNEGTYSSSAFRVATYRRYLSDFPANAEDLSDPEGYAYPEITRLSLERMRTLFMSMYRRELIDGDVIVRPPDTGNAGLAANRY